MLCELTGIPFSLSRQKNRTRKDKHVTSAPPHGVGAIGATYPLMMYGMTRHDVYSAAKLKGQLTSPKGYLFVARSFLLAFELVGRDGPHLPRVYLASHALECLLKAYIALIDAALVKRLITRGDGHDLRKLWTAAAGASRSTNEKLSINPEYPYWIRTLAGYHAKPISLIAIRST